MNSKEIKQKQLMIPKYFRRLILLVKDLFLSLSPKRLKREKKNVLLSHAKPHKSSSFVNVDQSNIAVHNVKKKIDRIIKPNVNYKRIISSNKLLVLKILTLNKNPMEE